MIWIIFFIPGLIFSHFRWVKDQEIGIKTPIVLKSPYDYHKEVFRLPFSERIGLPDAKVRMKYRVLREGKYKLEARLNYHLLFKVGISDSGGYLQKVIPATWLKKYNTMELNLSGEGVVGDVIEVDSIWLWVDLRNRKEFFSLKEFIDVSEGIVNIVFPGKKNVKTLSSIALFSQATGFYFGENITLRVSYDAPGIRQGGIVVIGTPEEQSYISEIQDRIKDITGLTIVRGYKGRLVWKSLRGESVGKKDGVIVFLLNERGIPVIIASGGTSEGVWKSVTALVAENFTIKGNYRIVRGGETAFIHRKWVAPPEGDFSLSGLSWPGILLSGSEIDTVLRINFLPGTRFAPGGHRLHLNFSVDRLLDAYTSSVKVYFNNRLIGRFSIAQLKSGLDVTLGVPEIRNFLRIKGKLRGITREVKPALFIENSSRFHIPRSWSVELPDLSYLRQLAFPFGATYGGLKPAIIIDQMEIKRFELGVIFSRYIGLSGVLNPFLIFATSDSAKKRAKNRNLILIGHDYEILSPADSSLYVEEIIYPSGRIFRTFLILHCVGPDQANYLINLFSKPERLTVLYGSRVVFTRSGVKVINPLSRKKVQYSATPYFLFNPKLWIIAGIVLILIIIKVVRILRASA